MVFYSVVILAKVILFFHKELEQSHYEERVRLFVILCELRVVVVSYALQSHLHLVWFLILLNE